MSVIPGLAIPACNWAKVSRHVELIDWVDIGRIEIYGDFLKSVLS